MKKGRLFALILVIVGPVTARAEFTFRSLERNYTRALAVMGLVYPEELNFHTRAGTDQAGGKVVPSHLWSDYLTGKTIHDNGRSSLFLYYPEVWFSYDSFSPSGGNDGAAWQGKGFNGQATAGFGFSSPLVSAALIPTLWFAENKDYDLIETPYSSGYGDYWTVFDNLQRYGDSLYYDYALGESYLRFRYKEFSMGISSESVIIGPGQFNNIILSDNAGGFPHLDIGTDGRVAVGRFGHAEFKYIWGLLHESEYFDDQSDNDLALISGTYTSFAPSFIPNLTVGFNHQYYKSIDDVDGFDLVRGIPFVYKNNSASDSKDMMISATFSWVFPQVRFEFYGEWARNDYVPSIEDFFKAPEHTHGYTLGINQIVKEWKGNFLMMTFELTALGQERTREIRAAGPWYRHGWVGWTQGYTYNGQVLGAAIGPGSDSQTLKLSLYVPDGFWGLSAQRIGHDTDYFYHIFSLDDSVEQYSEMNVKLERALFLDKMELFLSGKYSYLVNYNYIANNDKLNFAFEIGFKYHW